MTKVKDKHQGDSPLTNKALARRGLFQVEHIITKQEIALYVWLQNVDWLHIKKVEFQLSEA